MYFRQGETTCFSFPRPSFSPSLLFALLLQATPFTISSFLTLQTLLALSWRPAETQNLSNNKFLNTRLYSSTQSSLIHTRFSIQYSLLNQWFFLANLFCKILMTMWSSWSTKKAIYLVPVKDILDYNSTRGGKLNCRHKIPSIKWHTSDSW